MDVEQLFSGHNMVFLFFFKMALVTSACVQVGTKFNTFSQIASLLL